MSRVIHARLDEETDAVRRELSRRLRWSDSKIVREGIKALASRLTARRARRIVGLGEFESHVDDLGSSKAHLKGFGP
ncbi:MAG: hypothetical protein GXY83_37290 [Rhodopirellula sp.]|nr:hypothetical protein [Rhodopirellula sp.]